MFASLQKPDFTRHPAEDDLQGLVERGTGTRASVLQDARKLGVSWEDILGILFHFTPKGDKALEAIVTALKTSPPKDPAKQESKGPPAARPPAKTAAESKTPGLGGDASLDSGDK